VTQRYRRYEAKFAIRNLLGEEELQTTGPERSVFARLSRSPIYSLTLAVGL